MHEMPPTMKGTPKPITPGSAQDWNNQPLDRFDKVGNGVYRPSLSLISLSLPCGPITHAHPSARSVLRSQFSKSPVSAWEVRDGTLGTFISPVKVHQHFAYQMRDLGEHGVTNAASHINDPVRNPLGHPTWKTPVTPDMPLWRTPKRMRLGVSGCELGPGYMQ